MKTLGLLLLLAFNLSLMYMTSDDFFPFLISMILAVTSLYLYGHYIGTRTEDV